MPNAGLVAISDLHVEVPENRRLVRQLRPQDDGDWLILAGDVSELMADIKWGLRTLAERFERVVWVPGNHELWTRSDDPCQLRGDDRYRHIVHYCQALSVVTPEDPFPVWKGGGGPVVVAPLFTLYDYSFGRNVGATKAQSLKRAHDAGVVCMDEYVLFPDPYSSIEAWCHDRVRMTEPILEQAAADAPTILVNHFPLVRGPTEILRHPEFAQWCGTEATADWHLRFGAVAVVYGHLHIPRTTFHGGVRFEEVSVGYPRDWARRGNGPPAPRRLLLEPV